MKTCNDCSKFLTEENNLIRNFKKIFTDCGYCTELEICISGNDLPCRRFVDKENE